MKVYGHPDPWILEHELRRRVESAHPRDGRTPTLILVPTSRLAAHLERRFVTAGSRRAWLGLHVRTFRGAAAAILDAAREDVGALASERVRLALVRRVLDAQPASRWSGFVRARPGAAGRVASAFDDLREAGVTTEELCAAAATDPRATELAALYAAYARVLDDGRAQGCTDEAGLLRAAVPHAAHFARAHGAVFLHGAYELLGIHVELLRALDAGREVEALVPVRAAAPATVYAERFARRFLGAVDGVAPIDEADGTGCGLALDALYDEACRPAATASGRVQFRTCQGATAEVETAVRHALAAIADGAPPQEIALVARSLAPYAGAIEEALADAGLPFTSSLATPLRRRPFVRDLLLLLRVVERDFPRAPTVELLRSPRIAWSRIVPDGRAPQGLRADVWSRRARIVRGIEEWTLGLPRWVEEDAARWSRRRPDEQDPGWRLEEARRIGAALSVLRGRVAPAPRTWSEHAARFRALLDELLEPGAAPEDVSAGAALDDVLADMARLEFWLGDGRRIAFGDALDWLEQAVDASEHTPHREDRGGIRVLDALQARGLTFEHVHLLGLNAGVFPRRVVDDPVLDDALRRKLREQTGRPLPLAAEALEEERLLLLLLLGASRASVEVSWQRAAEAGRVRSPSLALRELARVARGRPDLGVLEPVEVPSHPEHWLRYVIDRGAGLTEAERVLLLALSGHGPRARAALAQAAPELADGLRTIAATETFDLVDPAFDARIGRPAIPADGLSVSAFEKLAQCPLQYFFARVLGVREPEEEVDALELEPRELGSEVHQRLAELYQALEAERLLAPERLEQALARAARMLEEARGTILGSLGERMAGRFPVLWAHFAGEWQRAIAGFVSRDLRRIAEERARLVGTELGMERELSLDPGSMLRVRGRFDRVLETPGLRVIGDYKTGRRLKKIEELTSATRMLRGETLQVPLYRWLSGGTAQVEILGVGPVFETDPVAARAVFDGFESPKVEEGFLETVGLLLDLLRRGSFPLRDAEERCAFCPYEAACRHGHPPTKIREARDADGRVCAGFGRKSRTRPLLSMVGSADD